MRRRGFAERTRGTAAAGTAPTNQQEPGTPLAPAVAPQGALEVELVDRPIRSRAIRLPFFPNAGCGLAGRTARRSARGGTGSAPIHRIRNRRRLLCQPRGVAPVLGARGRHLVRRRRQRRPRPCPCQASLPACFALRMPGIIPPASSAVLPNPNWPAFFSALSGTASRVAPSGGAAFAAAASGGAAGISMAGMACAGAGAAIGTAAAAGAGAAPDCALFSSASDCWGIAGCSATWPATAPPERFGSRLGARRASDGSPARSNCLTASGRGASFSGAKRLFIASGRDRASRLSDCRCSSCIPKRSASESWSFLAFSASIKEADSSAGAAASGAPPPCLHTATRGPRRRSRPLSSDPQLFP